MAMDEPIIAVAVDGSWKGMYPLKWAVENLVTQESSVHLIHVYRHLKSIMLFPWRVGQSMTDVVSQAPVDEASIDSVCKMEPGRSNMEKYGNFCKDRKVKPIVSLLKSDSIGSALVNHITRLGISKIVIGNGTSSLASRWIISEPAVYVKSHAPGFCEVLPIYKDGINLECISGKGSILLPELTYLVDETSTYAHADCIEASESSIGSIEPSFEKVQLDIIQVLLLSEESKKEADMAQKQVATLSSKLEKTKKDLETEMHLRINAEKAIQELVSKQEALTEANENIEDRKEYNNYFSLRLKIVMEDLEETKKALEAEIQLHRNTKVKAIQKLVSKQKALTEANENIEDQKEYTKHYFQRLKIIMEELEKKNKALETEIQLHRNAKEKALREHVSKQEALTALREAEANIKDQKTHNHYYSQRLKKRKEQLEKTKQSLETQIRLRKYAEKKSASTCRLFFKKIQLHKDAQEKALRELVSKQEALNALIEAQKTCTKYGFEELQAATNNFSEDMKLGEGGSSCVYKATIRHMAAAIKIHKLQDLFQGSLEFECQVEIMSRIHHPHVVMLLGACPEKGCIIYEYMDNGTLQDYLVKSPNALPWYIRFRVCYEVASALMFLHSSQPEPIIHSHLKPQNIMLDHNFVSKISNFGMARFSSNNMALNVMDDPYANCQCDVYALGIVILQILTGKTPVGITDLVEDALMKDSLSTVLDISAGDWPIHKATELALVGLRCASPQPEDHIDLPTILYLLKNMQVVAEEAATIEASIKSSSASDRICPTAYMCPISQEVMKDPYIADDGFTYEYQNIRSWLLNHDTSPMTNLRLGRKNLIPNHSLRSAIDDWQSKERR